MNKLFKFIGWFLAISIIIFISIGMMVKLSELSEIKTYKYEGVKFKVKNEYGKDTTESEKLLNKVSSTDNDIFKFLLETDCLPKYSHAPFLITDGKYNGAEILIMLGNLGEGDDNAYAYAVYRSEAIRKQRPEWSYYILDNSTPIEVSNDELNEKGFRRYKNDKYDEDCDIMPKALKEEIQKQEEEYAKLLPEEKASINEKSLLTKKYGSKISIHENLSTDISYDYRVDISFVATENLTNELTIKGAYREIGEILSYIKSNCSQITDVTIFVSYPMVDKYGATNNETIIKYNMTKELIDRCVFTNLDAEGIRALMNDMSYEHPFLSSVMK